MDVSAIPGKSLADLQKGGGQVQSRSLDQQDFLKLMVEQMRNQNPLEPKDNSEFVAQIAQFDTLSAVREMTKAIKALAQVSELANASSLVGRTVTASVPREADPDTGMPRDPEQVSGKVTKVTFDKEGAATVHVDNRAVPAVHIREVS